MADGLAALSGDGGATLNEQVARQIQDLGMTFRMTGDENERTWPLTPMPLIIGAAEWSEIERGLIQRATLLEQVAADIYGPQQLIRDGHLPAAVVTGSNYFAREMIGTRPRGSHYLDVYAVDLARGPKGQWRVLSDRVRLATGIGYALENRLAISRSTGGLLSDINTRRLAGFFAQLREGIAKDSPRDQPRIALMTPGRFNQSYPEQAHLARYLGFPLVEGRDLTVDDKRLYVRTIAGPKRIDAVWRWIDTNALDPLTFDSHSALGVPDLFEAWASGGLEIANCPGVEVLESAAFAAFLPRLFRTVLGQEPILPNVATWWCGQPGEARIVADRLKEMVIVSAFGHPADAPRSGPIAGADLADAERDTLMEAMHRRPMDFCGQEIVRLSTTPAMIGDQMVPRPFTLRAFVARGANGEWQVMPGGFARLSSSGALLNSLMGEGDLSADVCVVDNLPQQNYEMTALGEAPKIRRGGGILASQAADNLYWFGRYCERAEMTVRVVRAILGSAIDVDAATGRNPEVRQMLVNLLKRWGAIDTEAAKLPSERICASALTEAKLSGGVATLIHNSQTAGLSLRDRLAPDFWRIVSRPVSATAPVGAQALLRTARQLIERFSALSGLIAEDMIRGSAWRFLDLGRRIERALSICQVTRELSGANDQTDALNVLLDLCDCQITYRSRYLTGPVRDAVRDLIMLDPENPRSLIFQLLTIVAHIGALPVLGDDNLPERSLLDARAILASLQNLTVDAVGDAELQEIETRLLALSEAISARYFLQYEKPETSVQDSFLA
ncbi:MAG: circularly permuted type 2 ATP-grasp protein [Novosphingobium sp.]